MGIKQKVEMNAIIIAVRKKNDTRNLTVFVEHRLMKGTINKFKTVSLNDGHDCGKVSLSYHRSVHDVPENIN